MIDFPGQFFLTNQNNEVYGALAKDIKTGYKALSVLFPSPHSLVPTWHVQRGVGEETVPASQMGTSDTMLINEYPFNGKEMFTFPRKICFQCEGETKISVQVNHLLL